MDVLGCKCAGILEVSKIPSKKSLVARLPGSMPNANHNSGIKKVKILVLRLADSPDITRFHLP